MFEYLATINDGTARIKTIVKNLRTYTQLDCAEIKYLYVADLVDAIVALVCTQYTELTDFEVDLHDMPEVKCDSGQINQVLMNFIVNACDAIRERQQQDSSKGLLTITNAVTNGYIEIRIADNGGGMDEQTKQPLFEPFYTTKEVGEGTGLGLSISYGIMEKHRGKLEVESTQGQGSCFVLSLPF